MLTATEMMKVNMTPRQPSMTKIAALRASPVIRVGAHADGAGLGGKGGEEKERAEEGARGFWAERSHVMMFFALRKK